MSTGAKDDELIIGFMGMWNSASGNTLYFFILYKIINKTVQQELLNIFKLFQSKAGKYKIYILG